MKRYAEAGNKIGMLRHERSNRSGGYNYVSDQSWPVGKSIPSAAIREVMARHQRVPTQVVDKDGDGIYTDIYADPPVTDPALAVRIGGEIAALIHAKLIQFRGRLPESYEMRHFMPVRPDTEL